MGVLFCFFLHSCDIHPLIRGGSPGSSDTLVIPGLFIIVFTLPVKIETLRAFYLGYRVMVECDIVLPPDMPVSVGGGGGIHITYL